MSLSDLKIANLKRFTSVKLTKNYSSIVNKMLANKARYVNVQNKTGVPWPVIAAIHVREASMSFNTQLAQGDPLSHVSTHVPRGQGPYFGPDAWERAALIALEDTGGTRWIDWTAGGWTTFLEKYNGLGYANKGRPSPYVWAGTNQYTSGKYVADGQYSASAVDIQPGCANLILALAKLDPSINVNNLSISKSQPTKDTTTMTPMLNWKTTITGVAAIFAAIGTLFTNGVFDISHLSTAFPAIIAGFGLIFAKDFTTHSTPAEVASSGAVSAEPQPNVVVTPVKPV